MTREEWANTEAEEEPTEIVDTDDIETFRQALAEAKAKAEDNLAGWQRTQADFINYKRRSEQEKEEIGDFAKAVLALNLLPVLDDFKRALGSIPPRLQNQEWVDGVRLIERKLQSTLEAQGLSEIKALGEPFDPNFHEAVMQAKGKEGMVIQEVQKGYKFHDRVIQPAKVMVGNGEEDTKEE